MSYSLENVKRLREETGIGIKKCMESLKLNDNDFQKSLNWLKDYSVSTRKLSFIDKDSLKNNNFGIVVVKQKEEKILSFILKCESDFAEKSEEFKNLSENLADVFFENFQKITNCKNVENEFEKISEQEISSVSLSIREKYS